MTRRDAREIALHMVFSIDRIEGGAEDFLASRLKEETFSSLRLEHDAYEALPDAVQRAYIERVVSGVYARFTELDEQIRKYAVGWEFARLSRMTLAILRLAMYEILYMEDVPDSAAANEAVELAKLYDDEDAASFINGILGSFIRGEVKANDENPDEESL